MVQIPTYQARQGLETPRAPELPGQVPVDTSVGRALGDVGGALSNLGQHMQARQQQKASFDAQLGYDTLQEQLNQDKLEFERNAPADGTGLHDTFMEKSFTPRTEAFLGSIKDKNLQEKFRARISSLDSEHWGNDVANREYEIGNKHSQDQINTMWGKRAQAISQDPAAVENYVAEMDEIIASAPNLTTAQREEARAKVRETAPAIVAESLKQVDPEALYFASGNGTGDERIDFLLKRMVPALTQAESSGNPNAVSKKGAIGLMQVMPGTAVEIAKKLGDTAYLEMDPAQRAEYLSRPDVNMRYGTAYLAEQLKKYGGDAEAALIAYNAGPANADKWLEAGRDYSVLPKREETEPYVEKIMGAMGAAKFASGVARETVSTHARDFLLQRLPGKNRSHIDKLDGGFANNLAAMIEAAPPAIRDGLQIQSGARSIERQTELFREAVLKYGSVAAARKWVAPPGKSKHNHGQAVDLMYNGQRLDKAPAEVRQWVHANAAKFGMHFPLGNEAWHIEPLGSRGGKGAAPTQMATATPGQQPMQGSPVAYSGSPRSGFVSAVFTDMPTDELQRWQSTAADLRLKADDVIKQQQEELKAQMKTLIAEDVASIGQTGKSALPPAQFETASAAVFEALGPEEHGKWLQDRAVTQRVYDLANNAETMPQEAMTALLQNLTPKGGANAVEQQQVFDKVRERFDAVQKLRDEDPGLAVLQTPAMRDAAKGLNWSKPDQVQRYLSDVEAAQSILGVQRALLPKQQAEQIGVQIRNVLAANPGQEEDATRSLLLKLQQTYGDYADDVFTQAFETILEKDLSRNTREIMSNTMLGWVQETPGMQDSRLMLQNNAAAAAELAAGDKQPGLGDEAPQRSWWGYLTGEPVPEAPPPPKPEPATGPKVEFAPITLDGVPPQAVDVFTKNAGNMRVQSMFRDAYGAPALKAMQDELKRRGAFAAAN